MSENADNVQVTEADELATLKLRADQLNIQYHPSISLEKLRLRVNEAITSTDPVVNTSANDDTENTEDEVTEDPVVEVPVTETAEQRRIRKRKEANKLIRIRVTCMNPAKKEWEGELFTAGNGTVGSFTKFVPFNVDEGWHVPTIIYNQLVERKCQIFISEKDSLGNTIRKGKLIREFAIEVLPDLSLKELKELAQQQAMRNGTVN